MAMDLDDGFENNENQMNISAECRIVSNGRGDFTDSRESVTHVLRSRT